MIRLCISGAAGRMGRNLVRAAMGTEGFELAAAFERTDHPEVGADAGLVAGAGRAEVPIAGDPGVLADADVLVDFSFHTTVPAHARLVAARSKPWVLGTTGLDAAEEAAVREAAERVPVVWAPNMSLGVNVLFAVLHRAASALGVDYDAEIVETHHRHKRDAPSGTALRLAEIVATARGQVLAEQACHGRRGQVGERPGGQIGLHAVRAGDTVGDHRVILAADGERVELAHRATSRGAFAGGALRAAAWVPEQGPGLYDMKDVLGL